MKYTVQFFIDKFEKIPEELWDTGGLCSFNGNKGCAYWHCGESYYSEESLALKMIMGGHKEVYYINDDFAQNIKYKQPTPKQRILAALYDIKNMQEPVYEDLTKELAVLPEDKIETDIVHNKIHHV